MSLTAPPFGGGLPDNQFAGTFARRFTRGIVALFGSDTSEKGLPGIEVISRSRTRISELVTSLDRVYGVYLGHEGWNARGRDGNARERLVSVLSGTTCMAGSE